jgi:hypothetical protein
MIEPLLITLYILSVFFNRWLDKKICQDWYLESPKTLLWFFPIIGTAVLLVIFPWHNIKRNLFTGKYWK